MIYSLVGTFVARVRGKAIIRPKGVVLFDGHGQISPDDRHQVIVKSVAHRKLLTANLKKCFLFEVMSDAELAAVVDAFRKEAIPSRRYVIQQGSTGDACFVVHEGRFRYSIDGTEVCLQRMCACFGLLSEFIESCPSTPTPFSALAFFSFLVPSAVVFDPTLLPPHPPRSIFFAPSSTHTRPSPPYCPRSPWCAPTAPGRRVRHGRLLRRAGTAAQHGTGRVCHGGGGPLGGLVHRPRLLPAVRRHHRHPPMQALARAPALGAKKINQGVLRMWCAPPTHVARGRRGGGGGWAFTRLLLPRVPLCSALLPPLS